MTRQQGKKVSRSGNNRTRKGLKSELKHIHRALEGEPFQIFCPPEPPRLRFSFDVSRVVPIEIYYAYGADIGSADSWFGTISDPAIWYLKTTTTSGATIPIKNRVQGRLSMEVLGRHINAMCFPDNMVKSAGYAYSGVFDPSTMSYFKTIRIHSVALWGSPQSLDAGMPIKLGLASRLCTSSSISGVTPVITPMVYARDEGSRLHRSHVKVSCPNTLAIPFNVGKVAPSKSNFTALSIEFGTMGLEFQQDKTEGSKRSHLLGLLHISFTGTVASTDSITVSGADDHDDVRSDSDSSIELVSNASTRTRNQEVHCRSKKH